MKLLVNVFGALVGYGALSYWLEGVLFSNPLAVVSGVGFALASAAAVPVWLAIVLGICVVSGIMSIGSYLARVLFRKLGAA
jgi:hypothetical protein